MVSITIIPASRPPQLARSLPLTLQLPLHATISDVKLAIFKHFPKFGVSRQKLSLKGDRKPLNDEATLAELGVGECGELTVKDLGPQIKWRTVFLIEYAGPLILHPLVWHLPVLFYGQASEHSLLQKCIYVMVLIHFIKRQLETLFVHRFSHGTMPAFNVFRNSAHYYFLSGFFLAYGVYSPTYSAGSPYIKGKIRDDPRFLVTGVALWAFFELSNLSTHIKLRNLRPPNSKERRIPFGYGFNLVSCPNYLFEILGWIVICVLTGHWSAWLFTAVGVGAMMIWGLKKHRLYRRDFGDKYPKSRKAVIPFII